MPFASLARNTGSVKSGFFVTDIFNLLANEISHFGKSFRKFLQSLEKEEKEAKLFLAVKKFHIGSISKFLSFTTFPL
jgi:hypothetical protein